MTRSGVWILPVSRAAPAALAAPGLIALLWGEPCGALFWSVVRVAASGDELAR